MDKPKSLCEAILNGLHEVGLTDTNAGRIEAHVKEFLSQRFSVAMLEAAEGKGEDVNILWESITGEKLPAVSGYAVEK